MSFERKRLRHDTYGQAAQILLRDACHYRRAACTSAAAHSCRHKCKVGAGKCIAHIVRTLLETCHSQLGNAAYTHSFR